MNDINSMCFLVVIETQKVKSYLFASPIMREIRGASMLLDLLNRKKTKEILKTFNPNDYELVYLGGGTGRILFRREEDAENFKNKVLKTYRQETVTARVSVEIVPRKKDDNGETFPEWMSHGVRQSQQNKLGQSKGIPVLAGRWVQPCTSCGQEPAEKILHEHGEHRLCRACLLKRREISEHLYKEIKPGKKRKWLLSPASKLISRYTDRFIFTTLAQYTEDRGYRIFLPQDFDDIGQASRPFNYMGFIYADGNRMGEVVKALGEKFTDEEEAKLAYKAFSEIMDQATREAAVEAVLEVVDIKKDRFVPAEFIMAGGDDLMLAVPGHNALDVAILFMERFQEKTRKLQDKYIRQGRLPEPFSHEGLTTSAGVVIAHAHYPVSDLMDLAGELMKIAKTKAARLAETKKEQTGTLDFIVLTEAGSEPIKDRRKDEYTRYLNSGLEIKLTERPYTTAKAHWLLTTIRDLKSSRIPRSKLKSLYPVLFQGPMQAQFDALRIRERLKVTGDLKRSDSLNRLVTTTLPVFPFRKRDDNCWTTPLTEIMELYDFIQPGKNKSTMNHYISPEKEESHDRVAV